MRKAALMRSIAAATAACSSRLRQRDVREERSESEACGDARERKPRQAAAERFEQHEAGNDPDPAARR
jgi:hypothetical protein